MSKELNQKIKETHQQLRWDVIDMLTKKYSDDAELGKWVREFVELNQNKDDTHNNTSN